MKKKEKSYTVFENDSVKAFLAINPVSNDHTLIIPKTHYESIYDIPNSDLDQIINTAKTLAIKYKEKLKTSGINIFHASGQSAQQSVFHFHIHLVLRYKNDRLNLWFH